MKLENEHTPVEIKLGRFSYTHNRFLLALLCLAAAGFVFADFVGGPLQPGMGFIAKLASHQMIWALLMLPITAFGYIALHKSGHRNTAISCAVVGIFFVSGVAASVFWV